MHGSSILGSMEGGEGKLDLSKLEFREPVVMSTLHIGKKTKYIHLRESYAMSRGLLCGFSPSLHRRGRSTRSKSASSRN